MFGVFLMVNHCSAVVRNTWVKGERLRCRAGDAAAGGGKEGSSDGAGANSFRSTPGTQFEWGRILNQCQHTRNQY